MLVWADAMDYAFRALALMNLLLLLIFFLMEHKAARREKLLQEKIDLIGMRMGLREEFAALDHKHGRDTGLAALDDYPDSTPG